ncbi:hypothetical protein [Rubrivivax gelatinosus]|uniref:hypothetical protein n=1 Tax=Rubrivivax gelatinosus TaxID=28068 RepID=UPI001907645D
MIRVIVSTPRVRAPWVLPLLLAALGALQTLAYVQTSAWPLGLVGVALLALAVARVAPAARRSGAC